MTELGSARVTLPLSPDQARNLRVGDIVYADGEAVVTAGLPTHVRVLQALDGAQDMPMPLTGQTFLHMGVCSRPSPEGLQPLYANPTTSTRFAAHMPALIRRLGLTAVGGKGGLDAASVEAMRAVGCVYFSMIGGASPLLSPGISAILETQWDDLPAQFRMTRLRLDGFGPLTVAIDAHGHSLYDQIARSARDRLPDILETLRRHRTAAS